MEKKMLEVNDICSILNLGRATIYKLIKSGKIPASYIGSKYLIKQIDLENYINRSSKSSRREKK